MHVTPDEIVYWQSGPIVISATLVFTWAVMLLMVVGSWLITRRLTSDAQMSPGQNLLEIIVMGMQTQIREVSRQDPGRYLPFVGTLFLFILVCNVLGIIPGYIAPTGSLATTAALAICVAVAVPYHGIREQGLRGYLRQYLEPTVIMLPSTFSGTVTHPLAGRPVVRQCHERRHDRGHSADYRPPFRPCPHAGSGPADRSGAGVYLRDPRDGLYRLGNAGPPAQPRGLRQRRWMSWKAAK